MRPHVDLEGTWTGLKTRARVTPDRSKEEKRSSQAGEQTSLIFFGSIPFAKAMDELIGLDSCVQLSASARYRVT